MKLPLLAIIFVSLCVVSAASQVEAKEASVLACRSHYELRLSEAVDVWHTDDLPMGRSAYSKLTPTVNSQKETEFLSSNGPWFLDGNHSGGDTYGAGFLHLIAFAWLDNYLQSHPDDFAAVLKAGGKGIEGDLGACIDLRNAVVNISARSRNLDLKKGNLLFWFQAMDSISGKTANYAFTADAIDSHLKNDEWSPVTLNLGMSIADWTCLGATTTARDNRYQYGCAQSEADFAELISRVNMDFGIILLLPRSVDWPHLYTQNAHVMPSGSLDIRTLTIEPEQVTNEVH